jgi:hypothetical protein
MLRAAEVAFESGVIIYGRDGTGWDMPGELWISKRRFESDEAQTAYIC